MTDRTRSTRFTMPTAPAVLVARIAAAASNFLPVAPTSGSYTWKRQQAMFEAIAAALIPPGEAVATLRSQLTIVLRGDLRGRVGADRDAFDKVMLWLDMFDDRPSPEGAYWWPPVPVGCDSGSDRNGGDASAAPGEASQSGAAKTAHRPESSPEDTNHA